MSKSIKICVLLCLILTLNSFADDFFIKDLQDATNWGDWFLPEGMEPKTGTPPKYLPYYRWDDNDWGWTHTPAFVNSPTKIISATLEVEAWDVRLTDIERHELYGDGIYLGPLTQPPGTEDLSPNTFVDLGWSTTKIILGPEALAALMDGSMDIWLDIDATTNMPSGEGCRAVTLRSSTLTVYYSTNPSDGTEEPTGGTEEPTGGTEEPTGGTEEPTGGTEEPTGGTEEPTGGTEEPADDDDEPVDDDEEPVGEPEEPAGNSNDTGKPVKEPDPQKDYSSAELVTYTFESIDESLPRVGDFGDGISQIGVEQAWFAFDISVIPDDAQVVSARFSADMIDYNGEATQRTLWYHSDDSWIVTKRPNLSDLWETPADGPIVGKVVHDNSSWALTTIDIDVDAFDLSSDLIDNYLSLMLTGPESYYFSGGAVNITNAELEISIVSGGQIDDSNGVMLALGKEEIVRAGDMDIIVPGYSVPSFVDWNNDGLKDLVIGEGGSFGDAKILVYLNIGTKSEPQFLEDLCFYAQSYNYDLTCAASGCLGCFPRVVYWDADECKDLLVGQSDGTVKIFKNKWTDSYPIFDDGTLLQVGGSNIDVGSRATPSITDWNNDGKKDLVVGAMDGRIHLFINEGTDTEPVFIKEIYAQENGSDLIVPGGRSSPEVRDLDGDGCKDILTGNTDGQILLYVNVGTDKAPEFSGYSFVESDGFVIDLEDSPRSRPFVCDWTADGYLDVLVGAGDGKVHLYQSVPE
ncbi:MAG: VCBS repeat-containing protein [Sedimentisphaerales bacterium]|nr:VCBS repeat-containing protein [Sedimentisphaerales bacterium]